MTDSFFNNDDSMPNDVFDESLVSDEEDDDYNAFNNETFGEDSWTGDWEEDHEKMAEIAELSRHHFNDDDGELSNKIANFILDDDDLQLSKGSRFFNDYIDDGIELNGDESQRLPDNLGISLSTPHSFPSNLPSIQNDNQQQQVRPKPRPPPGFVDNQQPFPIQPDLPKPLPLKNICTVEEIERSLRKPPPTSLRLEDLERNLIASVAVNKWSGLVGGVDSLSGIRPATLGSLTTLPGPRSINILPFLPLHPLLMQHQLGESNHNVVMAIHQQQLAQNNAMGLSASNSQSSEDPYDGIMVYKEKQWLASVQISQIQSNPTYQNDYYYAMYQHRQSGGRKINALKKSRDMANSLNKTVTSQQYTPQQFENSLGKIQACSVTAPRKIIDMEIVEKSAPESPTSQQVNSSMKRHKQILLEIEQMYMDVLKAEEAISPLMIIPTDPDVDAKALFTKTVNHLLKKDNLSTILNIRKGKALVVRVMSHPEVCINLAKSLLALLPDIAMSDSDQSLLRTLPSTRQYLQTATPEEITKLAQSLEPHLHFLSHNKFGISILANMLERGECLDIRNDDWCHFIGSLRCCDDLAIDDQRPVVGIPATALSRLLSRAQPPLSPLHISTLTYIFATLNSLQS